MMFVVIVAGVVAVVAVAGVVVFVVVLFVSINIYYATT